jgi:hypothetical protein
MITIKNSWSLGLCPNKSLDPIEPPVPPLVHSDQQALNPRARSTYLPRFLHSFSFTSLTLSKLLWLRTFPNINVTEKYAKGIGFQLHIKNLSAEHYAKMHFNVRNVEKSSYVSGIQHLSSRHLIDLYRSLNILAIFPSGLYRRNSLNPNNFPTFSPFNSNVRITFLISNNFSPNTLARF